MYTRCYTFLLLRKITPQYVVATSVFCKKWRYSVCQYFFLVNFVLKRWEILGSFGHFQVYFAELPCQRPQLFHYTHQHNVALFLSEITPFDIKVQFSGKRIPLLNSHFLSFMATFLYCILGLEGVFNSRYENALSKQRRP